MPTNGFVIVRRDLVSLVVGVGVWVAIVKCFGVLGVVKRLFAGVFGGSPAVSWLVFVFRWCSA